MSKHEELAKLLCRLDCSLTGGVDPAMCCNSWQAHVNDAGAVFDLLMEPDEAMVKAGQRGIIGGRERTISAFRAMLTAAKEGK